MVRLADLAERCGGEVLGEAGVEVRDVRLDSRAVRKGELFAALPGTLADGAAYVAQAKKRGAVAVLSPEPLGEELGLPNWVHPEARRAAGLAAAEVQDHPARDQFTVAVTGTNGKTTVAHLAADLLRATGHKPGLSGTVEVRLHGAEASPATHTTPDAPELQRLCRRNLRARGDSFVLEASSHALDQERLAGLELDVAVFTNLGRDHLDYHSDLESYARAKERLFEHLKPGGTAVIHAADPASERMLAAAKRRTDRVVTYGVGSSYDLSAVLHDAGPSGSHVFLEGMGIPRTGLFLPLVGRHNVENALAALAATLLLEASPSRALEGLASISPPPGRLERVDTPNHRFQVFIDYAHTPEALANVLGTLRGLMEHPEDGEDHALIEGRLLCLFGCGGDRDTEKRAPMGAVVGEYADLAIVTSDNPRHEDPDAIIRDVLLGFEDSPADVVVEPDRRAAIRQALRLAEPNDVLLIAGKGHETWQNVRDKRLPFEDRKVVREELP